MSRSGYSEDYDESFPNEGELYRANVERTISGKRGQAFLRELLTALDAMPEKRLIADDLVRAAPAFVPPENAGLQVCAIGALGRARGLDMQGVNPDDPRGVARVFKITEALAREVVFENDEGAGYYVKETETPEARWQRMRNWVARQLKGAPP